MSALSGIQMVEFCVFEAHEVKRRFFSNSVVYNC